MAAGLSIDKRDFPAFAGALQRELERLRLDEEILEQALITDGDLPADCLTMEFARLLDAAGPWGQHFPEPLFRGCFEVLARRIVGEKHLKLELAIPGSGNPVDAIAFNPEPRMLAAEFDRVDLVYRLQINEFRGRSSLQLVIENLEISETAIG